MQASFTLSGSVPKMYIRSGNKFFENFLVPLFGKDLNQQVFTFHIQNGSLFKARPTRSWDFTVIDPPTEDIHINTKQGKKVFYTVDYYEFNFMDQKITVGERPSEMCVNGS